MSVGWKDGDVHSWSAAMSEILRREYPGLAGRSDPLSPETLAEMKAAVPPGVHHVLDKIKQREAMHDRDLCGVTPAGMLLSVWEQVKGGRGTPEALGDMLADIGGTCLQGDTHRLFSLYIANERSMAVADAGTGEGKKEENAPNGE